MANAIAAWQYEAPYTLYNHPAETRLQVVNEMLNVENQYFAIVKVPSELIGFCCFGQTAQVSGGGYREEGLDIGMGLCPDDTGQGKGRGVAQAVLDFADRLYGRGLRRVSIAEFNLRARHVWQQLGFKPTQRFDRPGDGLPFVVLTLANCEDENR